MFTEVELNWETPQYSLWLVVGSCPFGLMVSRERPCTGVCCMGTELGVDIIIILHAWVM